MCDSRKRLRPEQVACCKVLSSCPYVEERVLSAEREKKDAALGVIAGAALVLLLALYVYPYLIWMAVTFSVIYVFYGAAGIMRIVGSITRQQQLIAILFLLILLLLYVPPVVFFDPDHVMSPPAYLNPQTAIEFVLLCILLLRIAAFVFGVGWVIFLFFSQRVLNGEGRLREMRMGPAMLWAGRVFYAYIVILVYLALRTCVVMLTGLYNIGLLVIPVQEDIVFASHLLWIPVSLLSVAWFALHNRLPLKIENEVPADKLLRARIFFGLWLLLVGDLFWEQGITTPIWLLLGSALIARAIKQMAIVDCCGAEQVLSPSGQV